MSLVQNFTSFLVKPFIFAVNIALMAKSGDKVDPLEMLTSETVTFLWVDFVCSFHLSNKTYNKNEWVHQKAGEILNNRHASNMSV